MVIGIVQWVIISLILIMLVHHLYSFFKNTLTVPKVKDLVHQPSQLYKEIEETLISSQGNNANNANNANNTNNLSSVDTKEMKTELKNFFNELSHNKQGISTVNANSFPQMGNLTSNMYSEI